MIYNNIYTEKKLIKLYNKENILQDFWNKYLNDCADLINKILKNYHKKTIDVKRLKQKIIHFNTYIIGKCGLTSFIFFPKNIDIKKNQNSFKYEINFDIPIDEHLFHQIIKVILINNKKYKRIVKNNYDNSILSDIIIDITKDNDKFLIIIKNNSYQNKKIILEKDYNRLLKMFSLDETYANFWISLLLIRYQYYREFKESISLSVDVIYNFIKNKKYNNISLEAFAGSLNSNLSNYCSLFYDIEKYFGSRGSFLSMDIVKCEYEIISSNPPYIYEVMIDSSKKLLKYLNLCERNIAVFVTIPDWRSITEKNNDLHQISYKEKQQKRITEPYESYSILRNSKFFRNTIIFGNYEYYNFFNGRKMKISINTLIVLLSSKPNNIYLDRFKNYVKSQLKI